VEHEQSAKSLIPECSFDVEGELILHPTSSPQEPVMLTFVVDPGVSE